jgi:hypothetical protein
MFQIRTYTFSQSTCLVSVSTLHDFHPMSFMNVNLFTSKSILLRTFCILARLKEGL